MMWLRWTVFFCLAGMAQCLSAKTNFTISGIEDDDVSLNISAFVQNIDPPTASYQFDAYQQQVQDKALEAMQVFGYYQAQVEVKPLESSKDNQN